MKLPGVEETAMAEDRHRSLTTATDNTTSEYFGIVDFVEQLCRFRVVHCSVACAALPSAVVMSTSSPLK
jgi:hypothetical protein